MTDESAPQRDTVEKLADEFMTSYRAGSCPSVQDYARQYPELADQLRDLLTALVILEQNAPHRDPLGPHFKDQPHSRSSPREIGDFLIVREIARGGMGVVYEAIQQSLGRHVALKVLASPGFLNPSHLERFRLEARAAARLHHTHIVPVFGVGEYDGLHYYAMQFIQGQSLDLVINALRLLRHPRQADNSEFVAADALTNAVADGLLTGHFRIGTDGGVESSAASAVSVSTGAAAESRSQASMPRSPPEFTSSQSSREFYRSVARVGLQVAEALVYAHAEGILHRDIKPSNLLLDAKGSVWVTDFGLAKAEGCDGLTHTGDFVGTLRYMAPERLDGISDRRGDVYGLGVTLYEMLTLVPFLAASSRGQLVEKIRHESPSSMSKLDHAIPTDLETIVLKALAKEPRSRYQSAEELAEDLRRFLADRSILARRSTPSELFFRWCRRNPRWAAMVATVAGLLVIIAIGSSLLSAWALRAERETLEELFESKINEARSVTLSRRPGQRFKTLSLVEEARGLATELNLPTERLNELRNVAITAFTLPDLYPFKEWEGFPSKSASVDFDDNLEIYARTDEEGNCSIRRVAGDRELHRLRHASQVASRCLPCLSRDGRFVVIYEQGGAAQIWNIERDKPELVITANDVVMPDFHPNRREIVFSHTDGTITHYDLNRGQVLHRLQASGLTREVVIALHPTEPLVAVGSYFGKVVNVRDLETGKVIKTINVSAEQGGHVAWHPTGKWLAATDGATGRILVFDRATFQPQDVLGPADLGARFAFDHLGDHVAVAGWDQRIQLFDFRTGQLQFEISDANPILFPRFSRDDLRLAGFIHGTRLGMWQVGAVREYQTFVRDSLPPDIGYAWIGDTSSDGRVLAVLMTDGIGFWDVETGAELMFLPLEEPRLVHFESHSSPTRERGKSAGSPARASSDDAILIGESSGTYRWPIHPDVAVAGLIHVGPPQPLNLPPGQYRQSRDGRVQVTGFSVAPSTQPWAGVWIQRTDQPDSLLHLFPGTSLGFSDVSPDGNWVATAQKATGIVELWDARTGKFSRELPGRGSFLQFSSDGRWLVIGGPHGSLIDAHTWKEVRDFEGIARFSPDSRLMVVQGYTSVLRILEVVSGREVYRLEDPSAMIARDIAFTQNSRQLITLDYAKGIRVWDLPMLRQELANRGLDWNAPPYESVKPSSVRLSIQFDMGDFECLRPVQMEKNLNRAIEAAPDLAARWFARAEFHRKAGRFTKACADMRKAVKCAETTNDPRIWAKLCNDLARFLCTAPESFRDPREAVAMAEQAVKLRSGEWSYHNTLGIGYYRSDRFLDAVATLERSLANGAGQSDALDLYFLAMCHFKLGHSRVAQECFERARTWNDQHKSELTMEMADEVRRFRAEAAEVLGAERPSEIDAP